MGFPCGSVGKESACNAEDLGSIPGLGRSPGEGHGNPLQYSGLRNSMDRGAWWAIVHGVAEESDMTKLSTYLKYRFCRLVDQSKYCFFIQQFQEAKRIKT